MKPLVCVTGLLLSVSRPTASSLPAAAIIMRSKSGARRLVNSSRRCLDRRQRSCHWSSDVSTAQRHSHILHSIFYDVIEPTLLVDSGFPIEVRVFTCKIADKIFTICQGDLLLTPRLLDTLLSLTSSQKQQPAESIESTAHTQIKNLWQSIR